MIEVDKKGIKAVTGKSNRLIYADKIIYDNEFITLIDGTERSKTWTKHNVEEFVDEKAALIYIEEKKWSHKCSNGESLPKVE